MKSIGNICLINIATVPHGKAATEILMLGWRDVLYH